MMSQKYHILIVEDFAPDAELEEREIRGALPQCIFQRVETHNDFIAALAEFQPDLIVSDYQMSGFDGMTVLRITLERTPLTPVIIVTGSINEDTAVRCMKAGAVDYVLKDSLKRLGPAVQHALEQKQINLDRQSAQAALIESETRFRLLFETMAQGVVYQNADGQITAVNPAAERILGLTLDQMQGRTSQYPRWRVIHPDGSDFPGDTHPAMIALRTGQEVRNVLMGIWHPGEERHRWVRVSAVPQFRAADTSPCQVYATLSDVTELIDSEFQIRHLNAVLKAVRNINQLIVREHDRQRLMQSACESLLEARGFSSAYIVLFDAAQKLAFAAQSGWDAIFPDFLVLLASGDWPYCIRQGMGCETGTLVEDASAFCGDCPLAFTTEHKQEKKIIAPIRQAGQYQGVLTVALPQDLLIDPDELGLLEEVAGDLAFALRSLEIEDQRQQAETALRESEARYELANRATFNAIWDWDLQTDALWWNENFQTSFGYGVEDIEPGIESWTTRIHPEDSRRVTQGIHTAIDAGQQFWADHYRFRRKDGSYAEVEDRGYISRDASGQPVRMIGAMQDITERKRAEELLRQSEEQFRSLAENSQDYIMRYDQECRHLYENPAAMRVAGFTAADIIGKTHREAGFPEELCQTWEEKIQQVFRTGQPSQIVFEWESMDGLVYLDLRLFPEYDHAGRVQTVLGISRDVTDIKRAEDSIRKLNADLEHRVIARTAELQQEIAVRQRTEQELQQAKELAEQANRAKSDFLANMSHDLRTPLNAILGYAQILQDDDNLTGRQRHGLETIHTSGEHLLALINDILDLSKIEAGRLELDADDIHLPTFLNNIARMIQVRAAQKGLRFVQERDPALPEGIRADAKRLQEVLLNLLGNAVKFTEQGSVTLRILDLGFEILDSEDAQSKIKNLKFEIIDTGPGIAPHDLEKIFEPFQQVGEKRAKAGGTGLGLAIGRRLIRMMGGELQVESVPGQGSRFWFEALFPVVDSPTAEAARPFEKIIGYAGPRRTILIVDDEETNRNLLLNLLFPLGFRIVEAADGQECLEKAPKFKPDLILLDLRMPLMDGFSAIQQLRAREDFHEIPIIAVSASVFIETRQRALDIGFNDFLFKPIQIEKLIDLLQRSLTLEWIYDTPVEPLVEFRPPPLDFDLLRELPAQEIEQLYAAAHRGNHKKILEHLARLEQQDEAFRPLVMKLRALAQRFDTDTIAAILEDMGVKGNDRNCL